MAGCKVAAAEHRTRGYRRESALAPRDGRLNGQNVFNDRGGSADVDGRRIDNECERIGRAGPKDASRNANAALYEPQHGAVAAGRRAKMRGVPVGCYLVEGISFDGQLCVGAEREHSVVRQGHLCVGILASRKDLALLYDGVCCQHLEGPTLALDQEQPLRLETTPTGPAQAAPAPSSAASARQASIAVHLLGSIIRNPGFTFGGRNRLLVTRLTIGRATAGGRPADRRARAGRARIRQGDNIGRGRVYDVHSGIQSLTHRSVLILRLRRRSQNLAAGSRWI